VPDLSPRPRSTPLLLLLGLLAFVSLVLEYGMNVTGWASRALVVLEVSIAVGFGLEFLVGLWRSSNRRRFLRVHWFEALLLALLLTSLGGLGYAAGEDGAGGPLGIRVQSLPKIYLALVQVYLLGGALSRVLSAHELLLERQLRPETLLVGGFLALVLIGTALLMLPRVAVAERFSFLDALFTATSAVCVTGLSVRDVGLEMTPLGQGVLLSLFQVGGLGIVTFVSFGSILSGKRMSVPHMMTVRSLVSAHTMADARRQVLALVASAVAIEALGAYLLFQALPADVALNGSRAWWAVFHSVSAFCNAGFGLQTDSLASLRGAVGVNLTVVALLVLGGLGAPVLRELVRLGREHLAILFIRRRRRPYLAPMRLQARLAVVPTLVLLPLGALLIFALERRVALAGLGTGEALLASFFQSATTRTAGFSTVDMGGFRDATLLFMTGLMIVGASPVSTGGGIKTATVMVLFLTLRAMAEGRDEVEYHGRTIARAAVRAALSVLLLYGATAATGIFVLSLTDPGIELRDRVFEVISALSTVGLSTGVTASLSPQGRVLLCVLMFLGRVGPLSLMLDVFRPRVSTATYRYPTEPVLLG